MSASLITQKPKLHAKFSKNYLTLKISWSCVLPVFIAGIFLSMVSFQALSRPLLPYHSGDWSKLVAQTKGQAAIIHIWGFSCGPCVQELPAWGDFASKYPGGKLMLLEVDQVPEEMTLKTLNDAKLMNVENFVTAEYFDDYMRFEVDPKWMGELPITLLFDAQGGVKKLRGSADFQSIKQWANKNGFQ
jgi:thiol-disulfide isomerase/thioredoxin